MAFTKISLARPCTTYWNVKLSILLQYRIAELARNILARRPQWQWDRTTQFPFLLFYFFLPRYEVLWSVVFVGWFVRWCVRSLACVGDEHLESSWSSNGSPIGNSIWKIQWSRNWKSRWRPGRGLRCNRPILRVTPDHHVGCLPEPGNNVLHQVQNSGWVGHAFGATNKWPVCSLILRKISTRKFS